MKASGDFGNSATHVFDDDLAGNIGGEVAAATTAIAPLAMALGMYLMPSSFSPVIATKQIAFADQAAVDFDFVNRHRQIAGDRNSVDGFNQVL